MVIICFILAVYHLDNFVENKTQRKTQEFYKDSRRLCGIFTNVDLYPLRSIFVPKYIVMASNGVYDQYTESSSGSSFMIFCA